MAWFDSNGHHLVDVGNPIVGGVLVKGAESSDLILGFSGRLLAHQR